ncbi:type IV pilus biogenesis protein PilP [Roseateles sp. YR242]|uniref:hypothetical protein n=1 Tax=Roseateles sp. YR242 TaxID=1855305 RepID=UPI0008CD8DC7|nr:hypothetical protein [Roseateles sp. YR242]SEL08557.1 type IV pilus biogenesis protein PilP [Roseateles sp. YR242]
MPKASPIKAPAAIRTVCTALLALSSGLVLTVSTAIAREEGEEANQSAASSSMQQIIESARRKKAQELEAAARRMLGTDTSAPASTAPMLPPPPVQDSKADELPRVWSISGMNKHLEAELYYQGRIYPVKLAGDGGTVRVGPWTVRTISSTGVTVAPMAGHRAASRWPSSIVLPPPERGSSLSSYPFYTAADSRVGGPESAALPPSALRASQLPLSGSVAMAPGGVY